MVRISSVARNRQPAVTAGKLADNYDVESVALGKGGFAVRDSLRYSSQRELLRFLCLGPNCQEVRKATVRVTGAKRAVKIISKSATFLQIKLWLGVSVVMSVKWILWQLWQLCPRTRTIQDCWRLRRLSGVRSKPGLCKWRNLHVICLLFECHVTLFHLHPSLCCLRIEVMKMHPECICWKLKPKGLHYPNCNQIPLLQRLEHKPEWKHEWELNCQLNVQKHHVKDYSFWIHVDNLDSAEVRSSQRGYPFRNFRRLRHAFPGWSPRMLVNHEGVSYKSCLIEAFNIFGWGMHLLKSQKTGELSSSFLIWTRCLSCAVGENLKDMPGAKYLLGSHIDLVQSLLTSCCTLCTLHFSLCLRK